MNKLLFFFIAITLSSNTLSSHKMVLGKDERTQIKKSDKTEAHEAIGLIFYETRGMTYACSGTIIAPKVVLTAAHCIDILADTYFIPGQTKKLWKLSPNAKNAVKAKFALQFPGYKKADSLTTDVGIIVFDKEFKAKPLALTTQYASDEFVTIAGYPDDKKNGTLWEHSGVIEGASYTIDTYGGQSGSALRNKNNEIIGVHSHANTFTRRNYACMITPKHIEFIEKYTK